MDNSQIKSSALRTLGLEQQALEALQGYINDDFIASVQLIAGISGRLVVSGIGKSAIIAQKIVATLNSTGTAALFMHAADAIHGDLGMIRDEDVIMVISKSGDSPEIKVLVPLIKGFGNKLIGMVGNTSSFLATQADLVLNTTVSQEACPNNLAPTTSTTAQMVMGDALAVCLMDLKGFKSEDFARYHPGGTLGKKLYLRIQDLVDQNAKPSVLKDTDIPKVIMEITRSRLGAVAVVNEMLHVEGIITDGDIRRMLEKTTRIDELRAADIMSVSPKTIESEKLAVEALEQMRNNNISQLLVVDHGKYAGVVHLHDLVREGLI
jgi:arabinose-5-phosphate isomerase